MASTSATAGTSFDTISVPAEEPRETVPRGDDDRPVLRIESMGKPARLALLLLTLLGAALTLATIVAAITVPEGVFALGTGGALIVGGALMLIWLLQILFGALLANQPGIGARAYRTWIAAFILMGPFGLALYWFIHIWRAPYEPEREHPVAS